jgi:hypothetical protein
MGKPNMEAARAAVKEKALIAKAAIPEKKELARIAAQQAKAMQKNPPPMYYEQPDYSDPVDPEVVDAEDMNALENGFKKRAKDEHRRFALATDTEYWACLCFQTREQKEAFLKALKLIHLGDKYLDGQDVASVLGVTLPAADVPYNTSEKVDKTWAEFAE